MDFLPPGARPSSLLALQQIAVVEASTSKPVVTRVVLAALITIVQDPGVTVCPKCGGPMWVDHPRHCIVGQLLAYDPEPPVVEHKVGKQS